MSNPGSSFIKVLRYDIYMDIDSNLISCIVCLFMTEGLALDAF